MYQLTCRARTSGRGLVPVAAADGSHDPATAGLRRWTIFIHGFNNSEEDANTTWSGTLEELRRRQVDLGAVVLFFWPGDYSKLEVVSAMLYPKTVHTAEKTARLLSAYLVRAAQGQSAPLELSFVAHSLGSLVVLQTVRLLREARANVMIPDVLLMAAAVPEGFCVPTEAYGTPFSPETKEVVLYSLDDVVLKRYFKVGQKIAGRLPTHRQRAVGYSGGPGAGPEERWWVAAHMDAFDHSDYWKKPASVMRIARVVAPSRSPFDPASERGGRQDSRPALRKDSLPTDVLPEDDYLPAAGIVRSGERPTG